MGMPGSHQTDDSGYTIGERSRGGLRGSVKRTFNIFLHVLIIL